MGVSYIVEVNDATKKFKEIEVLHHVNLKIKEKTICGLVGRNGSGKTVLMKCICGFIPLTSGSISVSGKVIGKDTEFSPDTGFIIEHPGFLPQYSGLKNLKILSGIRAGLPVSKLKELMKMVGLDPEDNKQVGKYSMGMKQRLGLAQALLDDANFLILDEPFNGMDQQGVIEMRNLILNQKENGKTILLASHNKDDIQFLCDEVYQMDGGVLKVL